MNRTVVSGIAAFALMIGTGLVMCDTAEAGKCGGGLFSRLHAKKCGGGLFSGHHGGCGGGGLFSGHGHKACGGGLFARLKAKHAAKSCCAPEPDCCAPAPEPCCAPAPAPEPCCAPEPEPCCAPEPAPCCGGTVEAAPCCGGEVVEGGMVMEGVSDAGYDLAPGETLVPGSVETHDGGGELSAPASSSDAPAPAAEEAAPPAPTPDATTDA